jgi:hypothetical protein
VLTACAHTDSLAAALQTVFDSARSVGIASLVVERVLVALLGARGLVVVEEAGGGVVECVLATPTVDVIASVRAMRRAVSDLVDTHNLPGECAVCVRAVLC